MTLGIVILAAGEGKRMLSPLPKALHPLGGVPMIAHVLRTAKALKPDQLAIVHGHLGLMLQQYLAEDKTITWIAQPTQLGTGHALKIALDQLPRTDYILVLYSDVPCISANTLQRLLHQAKTIQGIALLTNQSSDPTDLGRIIRDETGNIINIIEEKDASTAQKAILETHAGIMVLPGAPLLDWLSALNVDNAQREYYLTDIIRCAARDGMPISSVLAEPSWQAMGVNTMAQLAQLERYFQQSQAHRLLSEGVTLIDPSRFDLRGELTCGRGVIIDINCLILGSVRLDDQVTIGAHCILKDVIIGSNTTIKPFSHIEGTHIGSKVTVGPYARLRAGTQLEEGVHVGNFVEIKNSTLASYSKANHFGYLGDAKIGNFVNIGAGTVTCNYDGANKFSTVIEKGAFIGSGTMLVAPVQIGQNATIGAGSVITQDAPPDALTFARSIQTTKKNWQKPKKSDDMVQ
ncbi:MAG: bifunctional UDP-N-acetylglucosamine diphosphorylase/glucosamine-1-phosphate N-acetyltransferase GlmU [Neisseriales bacterium]|nr:MAG: bifunctional UDP-N-acetylglucosamine diphosphorylase/glucosamine-1-phosphate N-acetyltransferase GlmU [Neisseriales bacterium]